MMSGRTPGALVAGRYELVELLGEGGSGQVWRAIQLNLGRDVAIKLLHKSLGGNAALRRRFEREARVAAALVHPNVVRVHDFGEDGDQLFLAMELLAGEPLRSIVDVDLPVPPIARTVEILRQVADALTTAHEMALVHRDIKPDNILLQATSKGADRAVVLDFGLAFIHGDASRGRVTVEARAEGTPDYMSPEQVSAGPIGPATDVYSLGCVFYEMLTGRVPFVGDLAHLPYQHLLEAPLPPRELRPDLVIPFELDELCVRMLAKLPAERPTMEVVVGALESTEASPSVRSRTKTYLRGRRARMVAAPSDARAVTASVPPAASAEVAVIGTPGPDLVLGLGANGLIAFVVSESQPVEGADAILATGLEPERLRVLRAEQAVPIIVDADANDMERVATLASIGVDEIVPLEATTAEVSHKVWRAIRRARRRGSS